MSRSGYTDDYADDHWTLALWRGSIASAIRGRRGQAFFRGLVEALDSMPNKRLVYGDLETPDGDVCALGAKARHQSASLDPNDTENYEKLGATFDIAPRLTQEVMYENDEGSRPSETPEQRWTRMRKWAEDQIRKEST